MTMMMMMMMTMMMTVTMTLTKMMTTMTMMMVMMKMVTMMIIMVLMMAMVMMPTTRQGGKDEAMCIELLMTKEQMFRKVADDVEREFCRKSSSSSPSPSSTMVKATVVTCRVRNPACVTTKRLCLYY